MRNARLVQEAPTPHSKGNHQQQRAWDAASASTPQRRAPPVKPRAWSVLQARTPIPRASARASRAPLVLIQRSKGSRRRQRAWDAPPASTPQRRAPPVKPRAWSVLQARTPLPRAGARASCALGASTLCLGNQCPLVCRRAILHHCFRVYALCVTTSHTATKPRIRTFKLANPLEAVGDG